ncbi:winged helix-turn-helix domain-containing protein [Pseudovibrio ascidiaceicola]|uniref:winged helix-turn-helix domain-containing protein n=1 Tax=Pseudovibrio ascidiaceicola TaxID=285279 RepID=UPI003D36DDF5
MTTGSFIAQFSAARDTFIEKYPLYSDDEKSLKALTMLLVKAFAISSADQSPEDKAFGLRSIQKIKAVVRPDDAYTCGSVDTLLWLFEAAVEQDEGKISERRRFSNILQLLHNGPKRPSEIADELALARSSISKSLNQLRQRRMIDFQTTGRKRYYSLTTKGRDFAHQTRRTRTVNA